MHGILPYAFVLLLQSFIHSYRQLLLIIDLLLYFHNFKISFFFFLLSMLKLGYIIYNTHIYFQKVL